MGKFLDLLLQLKHNRNDLVNPSLISFTIVNHQKKTNSMESFTGQFMIMTISLSCVEVMSSKTYEEFKKVSIYEPLENKHSGPLLGCSVLCGI